MKSNTLPDKKFEGKRVLPVLPKGTTPRKYQYARHPIFHIDTVFTGEDGEEYECKTTCTAGELAWKPAAWHSWMCRRYGKSVKTTFFNGKARKTLTYSDAIDTVHWQKETDGNPNHLGQDGTHGDHERRGDALVVAEPA